MLASGVSSSPDLTTLISLLTQLIGQADTGDWEAAVAMQPELCQRLAALEYHYQSAATARNAPPADRTRLAEIAALINKAELACATRRDQIAPLVSSLKALPDSLKA